MLYCLQGECDDDGTSGSCNSNKGERKRRHSSDNEDPVEKRKKFLERNRWAVLWPGGSYRPLMGPVFIYLLLILAGNYQTATVYLIILYHFHQSGCHSVPRKEEKVDREFVHQIWWIRKHQPEAAVWGVIPTLWGCCSEVHAATAQGLSRHTGHAGRCVCLFVSPDISLQTVS